MKKQPRYQVTVPEVNEIAGELVTTQAVAFASGSFLVAKKWALEQWGANAPAGARIRDTKDGTEYSTFGIM